MRQDLPTKEQVERLLAQARSRDPEERFDAVDELTSLHLPEVDESLVRAAGDSDPQVAALAIWELAVRRHPRTREIIFASLRPDASSIVHNAALLAASVVDIGPDTTVIWPFLGARLWVDRAAAASALARAGDVRALPRIRELAKRARALGRLAPEAHLAGSAALLGDGESVAAFLARLSGRSGEARHAAMWFLTRPGVLESMARIVGASRLRDALLAGRKMEERRPKGRGRFNYAEAIDELLERLDTAVSPVDV